MLDKLSQLDTNLLIYLNNLGTESWDGFWLQFTEKITHLPFMLVMAFLLFKLLGTKRFVVSLLVITIMITATDQLTNLAKYGFQRPRPCRVPELEGFIRYIAKNCGRYGYFSGHSSNSMAIAFFISLNLKERYKFIFPILIFWAFCMGYSRIYIGVHYPADLLTGFTVGALMGCLFYTIFKKLSLKYA